MKKFLALVLAVVMVMSMSAVAFAADQTTKVAISDALDYDADVNLMRYTGIQYGDTVYFLLSEDLGGGFKAMQYYEEIEKLKIKVTYEMGGDLVEDISVVKKAVDAWPGSGDNMTISEAGYYYFIAVKLAAKETTADADIIGTFEINRKTIKDSATDETIEESKMKDEELDFQINVFYTKTWLQDSAVGDWLVDEDNDSIVLDYDEMYALKFDYDDIAEISFGDVATGENEGIFNVDVSGQGKLYVKWNTNPDDAIVAANPGAKMYFVNFNNVKWNRTGEFEYEMEDGVAAYKVVDGQLQPIPGCEYVSADETFYFQTRVLESYVFADQELVNPVIEPASDVVVEEPGIDNPSTGA